MRKPSTNAAWNVLKQGGRVLMRRGVAQLPEGTLEHLGAVGTALQSQLVLEWTGEEVESLGATASEELRRVLLEQLGGTPAERDGPAKNEESVDFRVERVQLPTLLPRGKPLPIAIQGQLYSKQRAESASILVDGLPTGLQVRLSPRVTDDQGQSHQDVLASGLGIPVTLGLQHELELRCVLRDGDTVSWKQSFTVDEAKAPIALRRFVVGPSDRASGRTRILLDVEGFDVEPDDAVSLDVRGNKVAEAVVRVVSEGPPRRGMFHIEDWVPGIGPGTHPYRLCLQSLGQEIELLTGDRDVQRGAPVIHLERVALSPIPGREASACRLYARGFIENEFLVDCLVFEVDGMRAAVVGLDHLRPDVSRPPDAPIVTHQGFEAEFDLLDIQAGARKLDLIATQRGGEAGRLTKIVHFTPNADPELEVQSAELEEMLRRGESQAYGSIEIRGTLLTGLDDVSIGLAIDGRTVSEQRFESPGKHTVCLRAQPEMPGPKQVRFVASRRDRILFATNPAKVHYSPLPIPEDAAAALGALVDRFDLRSKILEPLTNRELLARLAERQPERIPELISRIRQAGAIVHRERERLPLDPPHFERRRLKVLVASWESPGPGHGGGVLLTELLKRLGERHDITLVHTYGIDEVGHAEALRPHIARLVSVPRDHRPGAYRGSLAYPLHNYENYVRELRRTIELEILTQAYDLVDFEYAEMGLYVLPGIPRVLTVHEVGHTAIANTAFRRPRPVDAALPDLDAFIRNFHYLTQELPAISPHLVMLTHEDAAAVSRFTTSARVYANPAGVSTDAAALEVSASVGAAPVLAYVGNYQHPPNVEAALFFINQVMPELRRRHPSIEFHLFGPGAPSAIQALDGTLGITVHGFVDDVRPRLREAAAFVAPIFTGAGQRIKILDAFGAGALVIATDLAMRGLALSDGEHYYRANTAEEFMNAVTRTIENPGTARAVARAGSDHAGSRHRWEESVDRREAIWGAALREAHR